MPSIKSLRTARSAIAYSLGMGSDESRRRDDISVSRGLLMFSCSFMSSRGASKQRIDRGR
jgi:hypothetical protein